MWIKKRIGIGLLVLCLTVFLMEGAVQDPILRSAFHHRHTDREQDNSFTLGKLILYFENREISASSNMIAKNSKTDNGIEYTFLFPRAKIGSEACRAMIDKVNTASGLYYSINIREVTLPMSGIVVTFLFDSQRVGLSEVPLFSMKGQTGIEFRLLNKLGIQAIEESKNRKRVTQIAQNRPSIVIDPGHGGTDSGALGINKIKEKDVALAVSKYLHKFLKKDGFEVYLTRLGDETVSLDDRTFYANSRKADLFVSIHANAAHNKDAHGIETFYYSGDTNYPTFTTLDGQANNFLQKVCNNRMVQSKQCAELVQASVCLHQDSIVDRSIKTRFLQVLQGTSMAAILVEVGFLTNKYEADRLASRSYQKLLARGIAAGIRNYYRQQIS